MQYFMSRHHVLFIYYFCFLFLTACLSFVTWFLPVCLYSPDLTLWSLNKHSSGRCSASIQGSLWGDSNTLILIILHKVLCFTTNWDITMLIYTISTSVPVCRGTDWVRAAVWLGVFTKLPTSWQSGREGLTQKCLPHCWTSGIQQPLVNAPSNLRAVGIVENLRMKTREKEGVTCHEDNDERVIRFDLEKV